MSGADEALVECESPTAADGVFRCLNCGLPTRRFVSRDRGAGASCCAGVWIHTDDCPVWLAAQVEARRSNEVPPAVVSGAAQRALDEIRREAVEADAERQVRQVTGAGPYRISNEARTCSHHTWLETQPPKCADCGYVDVDGAAYRRTDNDPFRGKTLLYGKHCRGPGCDDFNEAIPSCACPCSACREPRRESDPQFWRRQIDEARRQGHLAGRIEATGELTRHALDRRERAIDRCSCAPDDQDECCPKHGRYETLRAAYEGGREHERARTSPDLELLVEERDQLRAVAEAVAASLHEALLALDAKEGA